MASCPESTKRMCESCQLSEPSDCWPAQQRTLNRLPSGESDPGLPEPIVTAERDNVRPVTSATS